MSKTDLRHGHGIRESEITVAGDCDRARIIEVWEASVRATHDFLTEQDIQKLIPLARDELLRADPVYCLRDSSGLVSAFMGVEADSLEMLFVHPDSRGAGAGRRLVEYATRVLGARRVEVNEQNPQAVGFYERMGFRTIGRTALDPNGFAFPLLHMELEQQR